MTARTVDALVYRALWAILVGAVSYGVVRFDGVAADVAAIKTSLAVQGAEFKAEREARQSDSIRIKEIETRLASRVFKEGR